MTAAVVLRMAEPPLPETLAVIRAAGLAPAVVVWQPRWRGDDVDPATRWAATFPPVEPNYAEQRDES